MLQKTLLKCPKRTNIPFFNKPSKTDEIPLRLTKLTINNNLIEKQKFSEILGVLLDENLTWKEHIKYTENKIAKDLGLLYKTRPFFRQKCPTGSLLFVFAYLNQPCQCSKVGKYMRV